MGMYLIFFSYNVCDVLFEQLKTKKVCGKYCGLNAKYIVGQILWEWDRQLSFFYSLDTIARLQKYVPLIIY